jgi:hypothetical protein
MIHDEIMHRGAKRDGWKVRLFVVVSGTRNKLDDLGTHWHSSHTAIAISPTSASDIRYAVIGSPPGIEMCGRSLRSDHFGREPYPLFKGPRAVVDLCHAAGRHVRAHRLIESLQPKGSDGGTLTTLRRGAWRCGVVTCGRRPIRKFQ